MLETNF